MRVDNGDGADVRGADGATPGLVEGALAEDDVRLDIVDRLVAERRTGVELADAALTGALARGVGAALMIGAELRGSAEIPWTGCGARLPSDWLLDEAMGNATRFESPSAVTGVSPVAAIT